MQRLPTRDRRRFMLGAGAAAMAASFAVGVASEQVQHPGG